MPRQIDAGPIVNKVQQQSSTSRPGALSAAQACLRLRLHHVMWVELLATAMRMMAALDRQQKKRVINTFSA